MSQHVALPLHLPAIVASLVRSGDSRLNACMVLPVPFYILLTNFMGRSTCTASEPKRASTVRRTSWCRCQGLGALPPRADHYASWMRGKRRPAGRVRSATAAMGGVIQGTLCSLQIAENAGIFWEFAQPRERDIKTTCVTSWHLCIRSASQPASRRCLA